MTTINVQIDGAAAVIAAAQLRDDELRVRTRDPLWGRQLGKVAEAMERELYPDKAAASCRCADPVCPKVHPVDMVPA